MPKVKTYDEVKNIIESNDGYVLISNEYINNRTKMEVLHTKCGNKYFVNFHDFSSGGRCPFCNGTHLKTTEEYNSELKKKGIRYICKKYVSASKLSLFYDPYCKNDFYMRPEDVLHGHGCPICNGTPKYSYKFVKNAVESVPEYKMISTEYKDNKSKIKLLHIACGTEFESSYQLFVTRGYRCPKCAFAYNSSREEDSVIAFIKSIYTGPIIENYRPKNSSSTIELDAYFPELNIGIEFDGLYWHSSKFKNKTYHIDKTKFYASRGIRVVHIFEDEWINKREIIKLKIKSILNLNDEKSVYARKCSIVKNISNKEKYDFLEAYHIQGYDTSQINCALKYDNEIVAIMTFCKPRLPLGYKSKNISDGFYELSRFATSKRIPGGFSKLLKYAIKEFKIKKIITYADLRYSSPNSNVYLKNGFILSHISEPNYFYVHNGKRYHRFKYRKSELKKLYPDIYSDDKTEFQITEEAGLYRIYDCGNAVYTLEIN